MENHQSAKANKVLVMGNQGSGKSGLIGTLANADYRCFVLDFDNGLDVLLDPKVLRPEKRKNVIFKTCTDKLKAKGLPDGPPMAATSGLAMLDNWVDGGQNYGSVYSWGERDVLFIDTLTFLGAAIMRHVLFTNGNQGQPTQPQWGVAMSQQESVLAQLFSDAVKCNVVINAHVTYIGSNEDGTGGSAFPSALGAKLPPKVGSYFNSVLFLRKRPKGSGVFERKLLTQATANMELKCPRPSIVPPEMDADLAKYFELLRSPAGPNTPAVSTPANTLGAPKS